MNPKISIITITKNSEKTLKRTIESVIQQEYENLEYIIIDGKSDDGTINIIQDYADKITAWISEEDRGISDAFNKGIGMATGEIIGIINSDDGLLPGALQYLAQQYKEDIDVYVGEMVVWDEDHDTKIIQRMRGPITFTGRNKICHPSTFIKKDAYLLYGTYDVDCKYIMDLDLLMRFQRVGANFEYLDMPLAFFTIKGMTFSRRQKDRDEENIYVVRKNGGNNFDCLQLKFIMSINNIARFFIPKEVRMKAKQLAKPFIITRKIE